MVGTVVLADLGPTVIVVATSPDGTARLLLHDPDSCAVVTEVLRPRIPRSRSPSAPGT